ncbi:MAG: zinc-binding dehydrogenase [Deltaproteobacteria bacterium]|nr:zinc-binding dehydrogenase [Deltaproteobacteria bacterium]
MMKKAIYYGIRDVRVVDVPEPEPGPGQVKVKVKYCGICGSDLHEYLHGLFPESPFGHEATGVVVDVGSGVQGYKAGDRVYAMTPGSYAEYTVCPQDRLIKLSSDMDWTRATVLEPLAGAAYAIDRGGVKADDGVFIAGAGPVGLMILLGLKAMGLKNIYMSEIMEKRRKKAEELGATMVWNPREVKSPLKIKELTAGRGVDVAIEAVGIEQTLKDCLASACYRGKVIVQGIFTERAQVHMLGFVTRETTMYGTNSVNPELALKWLRSSDIRPESIVTSVIPLKAITQRGFDVLAAKSEDEIKILVEP